MTKVEWKKHHARHPMPVPSGTRVRVKLRNGTFRTGKADNYQWMIYGMRHQPTAVDSYRVLPSQATSKPKRAPTKRAA